MVIITPVEGGGGGGPVTESHEERQERLDDACSSLIEISFPRNMFTVNNLKYHGYPEEEFLELIEPISSVTNPEDLKFLFNTARESLLYSSSTNANEFLNFVKCMNWLKGELTKKATADAVLEKKNPEKKKEMSKADVALAHMLLDYAASPTKEIKRIQREIDELKKRQKELESELELETEFASISVDYASSSSSSRTQERKQFKSEIDELKKRQEELETECASIVADLKVKLGPIYDYEEPSITELRTESYKLYEKDCRFKGITATPILDEMGYATVVHVFGGIVKDRHFVKFLNDPARREDIENYFKEGADSGGSSSEKV